MAEYINRQKSYAVSKSQIDPSDEIFLSIRMQERKEELPDSAG